MDKISDIMSQPVIQYGFAGFSLMLLAMLAWITNSLLKLLSQNAKTQTELSEAIKANTEKDKELLTAIYTLHNKLISRPCIAMKEQGQ